MLLPLSNTDKIHFIYNDKLNSIGDDTYALSKTWYIHNEDKIKFVKNRLYNFMRNVAPNYVINHKLSYKDILWTTYKDYRHKIAGNGYSKAFLSCNMRATNDYMNTYVIAYTVNIFLNPILVQFFRDKGVEIDQDKYALSEMIQFIYRSAIRNNKDIYVYIPSKRMRNLLYEYTGPKICYDRGF